MYCIKLCELFLSNLINFYALLRDSFRFFNTAMS